MITKEILQQMLIDKAKWIILPVSTYIQKGEKIDGGKIRWI